MKGLKRLGKKIIIYIVIFMLVLSTIGSGSVSAYSVSEVGSAIAGFARNFVEDKNQGTGPDGQVGYLRYTLGDKLNYWDSHGWGVVEPSSDGLYWFCCATFVGVMYESVAGISIRDHSANGTHSKMLAMGQRINLSEVQPGDVLWTDHHVGIYVGDNKVAAASTGQSAPPNQVKVHGFGASDWTEAVRINEATASSVTNLNTSYTITGTGMSASSTKIDYGKFFFNGIPDGKYSLASVGIFDKVVDFFSNLMQYIVAIIVYVIRVSIIGYVSLFDRLLNFTIFKITGTNTSLEDSGLSATNADDPTSENRSVTVESILFNQLKLFDVNLFTND